MPLVTAAVMPHSPFLLPAIAKANWPLLKRTVDGCQAIAKEFHAHQLNTLVIFTPHGAKSSEAQIYIAPVEVSGNLKEFGDIDTNIKRSVNWRIIQNIINDGQRKGITVQLNHDLIDYGAVVPISVLALPTNLKIVVISINGMNSESTIRLGQLCAAVATEADERIGIIASADLSRRDSGDSKNWKPTTEERLIANAIEKLSPAEYPVIDNTSCCGSRPILALLAGLQGKSGVGDIISFEAPLKIGLITALVKIA